MPNWRTKEYSGRNLYIKPRKLTHYRLLRINTLKELRIDFFVILCANGGVCISVFGHL